MQIKSWKGLHEKSTYLYARTLKVERIAYDVSSYYKIESNEVFTIHHSHTNLFLKVNIIIWSLKTLIQKI